MYIYIYICICFSTLSDPIMTPGKPFVVHPLFPWFGNACANWKNMEELDPCPVWGGACISGLQANVCMPR